MPLNFLKNSVLILFFIENFAQFHHSGIWKRDRRWLHLGQSVIAFYICLANGFLMRHILEARLGFKITRVSFMTVPAECPKIEFLISLVFVFLEQATEASRRPSSMIMDNRKGSLSISQPPSLNESTDLPSFLKIDNFESGRAEAIGALCRIFCAKKTSEEILPVYLARFYIALQQGLKVPENRECEETLASILYNCSDLFRLDLDGIQVLLPSFIAALELVLPDKDLKMKAHILLNKNELRRASIQILLSILALPLHFQSLPIRDLKNSSDKYDGNVFG